jgi:hypothetical protein
MKVITYLKGQERFSRVYILIKYMAVNALEKTLSDISS